MKKRKSLVEKYKGMTFSEASKKIDAKYSDRSTNPMSMRSFVQELEMLSKHQELVKTKEIAMKSLKDYRRPVNVSKYQNGGEMKYPNGGPLVAPQPLATLNPLVQSQAVPFLNILPTPAVGDVPTVPNPFLSLAGQTTEVPPTLATPAPKVRGHLVTMNPVDNRFSTPSDAPPVLTDTGDLKSGIGERGGGNGLGMYTPLALGKFAEFAGKTAMLASGYDKVKPIFNPNEGRIESLMASRGIDTTAQENLALSQQNAAISGINSSTRSNNVRQAMIQNAIGNTLRNLQQNRLQQDQMNNQYKAEFSGVLDGLGQQKARAKFIADDQNQRAKAGFEQGVFNALGSLGEAGQVLTDYNVGKAQTNLVASLLSSRDFKVGNIDEIQRKAQRGELSEGDWIKLYTDNGYPAELAMKEWREKRLSEFKK